VIRCLKCNKVMKPHLMKCVYSCPLCGLKVTDEEIMDQKISAEWKVINK